MAVQAGANYTVGSNCRCTVWHTFDLSLPHTIASYVWADPVSRMLPTCTA